MQDGEEWGNFPGGPVVKILCSHARGEGWISSQGTKIPPATWQGQKKMGMKIMYIGECGMFKTKQGYWVGGGGSFKTEGTYTYTYG